MHAEVIAIGDELTSGQRLDSNSQWLSQRLEDMGVRVLFHTTVGDELHANVRVFREALDRADFVITTGGLGPTADDLTRQALADATQRDLELDQPSLEHIRRLFARRGRPMPARNEIQAYFPRGSRPIPNPHGSAPGIDLEFPRPERPPARLFALPGVPAEMREMWEQTVSGAILAAACGRPRIIRHHLIKCFGVGESDLEQMLPDLIQRGRHPRVGITVSQATITLRITAEGADEAECRQAIQPTVATIHDCLGDLVFGEESDELQDAVVRQLRAAGKTLASIESDAGGLLARWLSQADPLAQSYLGGLVLRNERVAATFSDRIAQTLHGSPESREQLVGELADECRLRYQADYGLALGPFPASDGAEPNRQKLFMALASADQVLVQAKGYAGHPSIQEARAVKQCLDLVRRHLAREFP